jgi:hypothetical protein
MRSHLNVRTIAGSIAKSTRRSGASTHLFGKQRHTPRRRYLQQLHSAALRSTSTSGALGRESGTKMACRMRVVSRAGCILPTPSAHWSKGQILQSHIRQDADDFTCGLRRGCLCPAPFLIQRLTLRIVPPIETASSRECSRGLLLIHLVSNTVVPSPLHLRYLL